MHDSDPNRKGSVAELKIAAAAAALDIAVFFPLTEHGRYDLVLEIKGRLLRVQCKHAPRKGDVVVVQTRTNRRGPNGYIRTHYTADEIDAICAYCPDVDECYLIPIALVDGGSGLHLRLAPPKNGQRASIHYAEDYLLGAVAQLEERVAGSDEARGSSPLSSTHETATRSEPEGMGGVPVGEEQSPGQRAITVGAHEFRNLFGLYMQRAARGEEFVITRWNKPYVRLAPTGTGANTSARA